MLWSTVSIAYLLQRLRAANGDSVSAKNQHEQQLTRCGALPYHTGSQRHNVTNAA